MAESRPSLPYSMTYPLPQTNSQTENPFNDREYWRQMYPIEVKRYLRIIVEVLDRVDFRESYIYDEYPDYLTLERLTEIILRLVPIGGGISRDGQKNLIRVLLYEEIYRRRQGKL